VPLLLAIGTALAPLTACGGAVTPEKSSTESTVATCNHGPSFVETSSQVVVPADEVPIVPSGQRTGLQLQALTSIAATPAGDRFLVTWTAFDPEFDGIASGQGLAALVRASDAGLVAGAAMSAPIGAQAVFDGTNFVLVGAVPQEPQDYGNPSQPELLQMERLTPDGGPIGALTTIQTIPALTGISTVIPTPDGLAITRSSSSSCAHALLVDAAGVIVSDTELGPARAADDS
jgi:hypothetical protein